MALKLTISTHEYKFKIGANYIPLDFELKNVGKYPITTPWLPVALPVVDSFFIDEGEIYFKIYNKGVEGQDTNALFDPYKPDVGILPDVDNRCTIQPNKERKTTLRMVDFTEKNKSVDIA
ncbi:MAG TPA: hypothetical protein VN721_15340 [Flavipsychrobacter sp.]|nr:hypothetical protein [Flavipsychrobacter sp.]